MRRLVSYLALCIFLLSATVHAKYPEKYPNSSTSIFEPDKYDTFYKDVDGDGFDDRITVRTLSTGGYFIYYQKASADYSYGRKQKVFEYTGESKLGIEDICDEECSIGQPDNVSDVGIGVGDILYLFPGTVNNDGYWRLKSPTKFRIKK